MARQQETRQLASRGSVTRDRQEVKELARLEINYRDRQKIEQLIKQDIRREGTGRSLLSSTGRGSTTRTGKRSGYCPDRRSITGYMQEVKELTW